MILSDLLDLNRINTRLLSKGRPLSHSIFDLLNNLRGGPYTEPVCHCQ